MDRIDQLTAPPVVGEFYLVPTVRGQWLNSVRAWPVMGELHEDTKFFSFRYDHYHLDRRFLSEEQADRAVSAPLHGRPESPILPQPVWRRLKCRRSTQYFPVDDRMICKFQDALQGVQARSADRGWICPHRSFSLGSVAPDKDGLLTCPLHGLRIIAATGVVWTDERRHESERKTARFLEQERERMTAQFKKVGP